jgi:cell division protein ZapA
MGELNSIKVTIGNRSYPLKVTKEEEEKVLLAAQVINKKLKEFEDSYSVRDKQDLLAMCALQFASAANNPGKQEKDDAKEEELSKEIDNLKFLIDDYLLTEETTL